MTDYTILNFLNTEGPFQTVAFLADMLEPEIAVSPSAKQAHERLYAAVESHDPAVLRMALDEAILRGVSTGLWRGWCGDVLRWMAAPIGAQNHSSDSVISEGGPVTEVPD